MSTTSTRPSTIPPHKGVSFNDLKFLKLMDTKVQKKNGHYCLPLPLKINMSLPNNRIQAFRRLHSLRRQFAKDQPFYLHYKGFMDELIVKGYARKAQGDGPKGN